MPNLKGKVAVVTGSTKGIGLAIAERLHAAGVAVVVSSRTAKDVAAVVKRLGAPAIGIPCDVADPVACERLVAETVERLGRLDILVNNAGITKDNLMLRMKDEDWDAVIDTNLRSAFVAIRAVQRGMMKRRWGRIINMASVVGIIGNKGQANYASSKAGLIGLTKSVAKELASRNILCNVVAPGFIKTDMTDAMTEEAVKFLQAQIPLERFGTPADVAAMVAFLASEHAAYITGQVLTVDGGMVM
jgi:3-oxoacyl-[acyl-carrier protein] reductase